VRVTGIAERSPSAIDGQDRAGGIRRWRRGVSTKPSDSSFFTSAVATYPGATALTRIPTDAHSHAIDFVIDAIPAFAAPYALRRGSPVIPAIELTLTMEPD
jgi:hypothetical protein